MRIGHGGGGRAPGAARAAGRGAVARMMLAASAALAGGAPGQQADPGALVAAAERRGARVAVVAVTDDGILFRHRGDEALIPASNQKLLTAAAALHALGPGYEFATGFRLVGGVLEVAAGGDPNWGSDGVVDPAAAFARVAAALRARGARAVRGVRLVLAPFDGPRRPDGWPRNQLLRTYCAPSDGLVLERGCVTVRIDGGPGPDATIAVVGPPVALPIDGRLPLTDDRRAGGRFHLEMRDGALQVRGRFHRGTQGRIARVAAEDPAGLFRLALLRALARGGVAVDPHATPADAELGTERTPLRPALRAALADSSNFHAEQILRVLGAEVAGDGSFAGGTSAARRALEELVGWLPDGLELADGSGLSRHNRVTADFLVAVLRTAARQPWAGLFRDALATAGEDGTLERRFRGSPLRGAVHAKTGTLRGVSALSGHVDGGRGREVTFAILCESERVGAAELRVLQERLVAAFAAAARSGD